jgi:tRNA A-37 threonylcarbamoyl transferase component Bud32
MKTLLDCAPAVRASLAGRPTFKDFFQLPGGEPVGGHPTRGVVRLRLGRLTAFLKREFRVPWKEYLASWWAGFGFVSKSQREWQVLQALRAAGVGCPEPLAVGAEGGRAFLLVRALTAHSLGAWLADEADNPPARRHLARALGRAVARLHAAGFTHPDLYAKHVFVGGGGDVAFIDFQRTRRRRWVGWGERCHDLAALDASLSDLVVSQTDRLAFLEAYLAAAGGADRAWRRRVAAAVRRRTRHLLGRRKVQQMRAVEVSQVAYARVVVATPHSRSARYEPEVRP